MRIGRRIARHRIRQLLQAYPGAFWCRRGRPRTCHAYPRRRRSRGYEWLKRMRKVTDGIDVQDCCERHFNWEQGLDDGVGGVRDAEL